MNIKPIAAALLLAACATPGVAAPITLAFEGANSFGFLNNFYNGGTDSGGASGPNNRVAFGPDAMAVANDGTGPGPNGEYFSNAPSPGTIMAPVGSNASLIAAPGFGFASSLSFYYSAVQSFTVDVLDAGNVVLGSLGLGANNGSCGGSPFCSWNLASLSFSGVGQSIRFGGGYDPVNGTIAGFDNITIDVPEPATTWLMASGLVVCGRARLRRKRMT